MKPRAPFLPLPLLWGMAAVLAVWAQEVSGGLDFLSPLVLVWLQRGRLAAAVGTALAVTLVQEGLSSFVLGATLAMAGLWGVFFAASLRLDPHNSLFMAALSLFLALWTPLAYRVVALLHDVELPFPSWERVALQVLVYWVLWMGLAWIVRRRGRHVAF